MRLEAHWPRQGAHQGEFLASSYGVHKQYRRTGPACGAIITWRQYACNLADAEAEVMAIQHRLMGNDTGLADMLVTDAGSRRC